MPPVERQEVFFARCFIAIKKPPWYHQSIKKIEESIMSRKPKKRKTTAQKKKAAARRQVMNNPVRAAAVSASAPSEKRVRKAEKGIAGKRFFHVRRSNRRNKSRSPRKVPGWISPVLFFASLVSLDLLFRTIFQEVSSTPVFSTGTMVFTSAWAVLITSVLMLLPVILRRIGMILTDVLFVVLAMVHGVMYGIFGNFFSFADMNFAGDGARFFSWDYIGMNLPLIGTLILSLFLMIMACCSARKRAAEGNMKWIRPLIFLLLAGGALFAIHQEHENMLPDDDHMSWDKIYDSETDAEAYRLFSDSNRCLMMAGLYQYTYRNAQVALGNDTDGIDASELDRFYEKRATEISGENEMTGAMEGKNLIMVMMESMDSWMITEDYTPNLYRIQQEGVNFKNFYTPLFLSAATFNTEILTQTGLIPAKEGISSNAYSTHAFPLSLAHQFRDCGYTANSFHSASGKIYSRGSIHPNLGFESYNNMYAMNMADYMMDSQMIGGYDKMVSEDPFFSFLITYSGHGPYSEDLSNISDPHMSAAETAIRKNKVEGSEDNMKEYTYAIAHAMEADEFVGELMDRLEEDDLLEDTVVVFYADHYGKYMTDRKFLRKIKGAEAKSADLYRTPCMMIGGGLEKRTVSKVCSSLDMVPTIANMFNLPADRSYYAGDDIFGDAGGTVIFPNNKWYDGTTYYTNSNDGEMTEEIRATCQEVAQRSQASMDTLRSNYFNSKNYLKSDSAKYNSNFKKQKTDEKSIFLDVDENDVAAVNFCAKRSYMEGGTAEKFYPEMSVTRGVVVKALWAMAGKPEPEHKDEFIDLPEDDADLVTAIQWASSSGLVSGYKSGKFKPSEPIIRQQVAAMLYRYAKYEEFDVKARGSLKNYTDRSDITRYAVKPMKWALGNHLITGRKDRLEPLENMTRGEFAHMLKAFHEYRSNLS